MRRPCGHRNRLCTLGLTMRGTRGRRSSGSVRRRPRLHHPRGSPYRRSGPRGLPAFGVPHRRLWRLVDRLEDARREEELGNLLDALSAAEQRELRRLHEKLLGHLPEDVRTLPGCAGSATCTHAGTTRGVVRSPRGSKRVACAPNRRTREPAPRWASLGLRARRGGRVPCRTHSGRCGSRSSCGTGTRLRLACSAPRRGPRT